MKKVVAWKNKIAEERLSVLKIGNVYKNEEITKIFLCSNQRGMRRSHKTNTLVLFADHTRKIFMKTTGLEMLVWQHFFRQIL